MRTQKQMIDKVLGFIEAVELPGLGIECDAKVDTGAATSSLHAERIEEFERQGELWVRFHVLFNKQSARIDQTCEARLVEQRVITSSNGQSSKRYIIETDIHVGGLHFTTEISLTHRGSMKYPMLIGRKAIKGRFIVDVSRG
ncbi:MAG: ATP-dependent zinc protease [Pseudomonadota bacterium]|nr:ATP-dependent zinc protease [Pseudomonadota bacterium]